MAKTAVINREQKRRDTVKKFAAKRAELLAIANNMSLSDEERFAARQKLQALPRDASPVRLRNRCATCCSRRSPAAWPKRSLTPLKPSRSIHSTAAPRSCRRA